MLKRIRLSWQAIALIAIAAFTGYYGWFAGPQWPYYPSDDAGWTTYPPSLGQELAQDCYEHWASFEQADRWDTLLSSSSVLVQRLEGFSESADYRRDTLRAAGAQSEILLEMSNDLHEYCGLYGHGEYGE